jgi:hypothetical protein
VYLLKPRNVEPEKQPLLVNDSETTSVSRQQQRNNGATSVARKQIINKLLRSNSFSNKHVPMETIEQQQKNGVSCAVRAEML